jgi:glycosyltransferase involved in cell wall biosynthesis
MYGRLQRLAFSKAGAFIVSNPWSLAFGRRYGMRNMVYLPFLMDETKYTPGPAEFRAQWAAETGGDFFVLMSSRLDYLFKGSNLAVNAFARFAAKMPGARLVIAGWGADKSRVEELFTKLGIENKVLVVPVAGKKRLIKYLRSADCLIDQLSLGYYGASALEGMACGLPVIMNLNREQYDALIPEGCAPVCHAETEDAVFQHLNNLHDNANYRAEVGEKLRGWFLKTHSNEKWGKLYEAVLWATSERTLPIFDETPLGASLGKVEKKYHASQLFGAPKFPNYV